MRHLAYFSLGSNLGNRTSNLRAAVERLRTFCEVTNISSVYETEPMEITDQPWFLNCVVEVKTDLESGPLLQAVLNVEHAMGREHTRTKGPRNIDIDLLLFDDQTVNTAELTLPHPAMHERRFVLAPLAEIAPGALHPILAKSACQLLKELTSSGDVRRTAESIV